MKFGEVDAHAGQDDPVGSACRAVMSVGSRAMPRSVDATCVGRDVVERLRLRRDEIEEGVVTRVNAIADPSETNDPAYAIGLRAAVAAAIEYGLDVLERGEHRAPPVPVVLLAQARLAARNGVGLDVVLRRYVAGFTLLGDFIFEEALAMKAAPGRIKAFLVSQASGLDYLTAAIGEEYAREGKRSVVTSEIRRAALIERLLAGEHADPAPLSYDLDVFHIGIVASGSGADDAIRDVARQVDCRLLLLRREDGTVWAWLGARRLPGDALALSSGPSDDDVVVAFGEPCRGLAGWRLTHRQALAALPIGQLQNEGVVAYREVALLAAGLGNDLHAESLHQIFIAPLERGRSGGQAAMVTLRAYFRAECNATSAAASLDISPQAMNKRLRNIEELLGRSVGSCAAALEIAVRLADLHHVPHHHLP